MGSSDTARNMRPQEEVVDLDADTKESTDELFLNDETAESPHKITLYYKGDTPEAVVDHFPKNAVHRQIGCDVTLGRNRESDVLMYEKHMARNFAVVTCRSNANGRSTFVLRNACDKTKQKRIVFTDTYGKTTDLLPTQEVELKELATFKLECVEFKIGIELGDVNSKTFEFAIRPEKGAFADQNTPGVAGPSEGVASLPKQASVAPSLESSFVGLPLTSMHSSEQVIPKQVVTPLMGAASGYNMNVSTNPSVPQAMPLQFNMAFYRPVNPYQQNMYGYGELQQSVSYCTQPPAFPPPYASYAPQHVPIHGHGQPIPRTDLVQDQRQIPPQYGSPVRFVPSDPSHNSGHDQLIERGTGSGPADKSCSCRHERDSKSGITMGDLTQVLANTHLSLITSPQPHPGSIITNPSSQDNSPVLYPSPANPRFRFPQPQPPRVVQQTPAVGPNPDLSTLPRGPPLGQLDCDGESIDLHPGLTQSVTGPGNAVDMHEKEPVEHEDKPK